MSDKIKALREALGLSQRDFGAKLGVSRDVICNLEYGRVKPKELFLHHMCQQYNVNEHWLKTGEGEMFLSNPLEDARLAEAIRLFQSLLPPYQEYALEQIRKLVELQGKS